MDRFRWNLERNLERNKRQCIIPPLLAEVLFVAGDAALSEGASAVAGN